MAERKMTRYCVLLLFVALHLFGVSADTNPEDAAALEAIHSGWKKAPRNWRKGDPCDAQWVGVTCKDSRVISLKLSSLGFEGELTDVLSLSQLQVLDLSFNPCLVGSIPSRIGTLTNLNILILVGCNLTGPIPAELGDLAQLTFLALNSNKLTGTIPASMGKLSNLYWFDIADNMITGPLPVSSGSSPGLDMLLKTKHFHFNQNKLSGSIPPELFNSNMTVIHILFNGNEFSGEIPSTIGDVKKLEVLRLDRNSFSGVVPPSLGYLKNLNELNLARNKLTGPIPDLTALNNLNYVDMSNNAFDESPAPDWFGNLSSLTSLTMEFGTLVGAVPPELFSIPSLQQIKMKNNMFNETLDMGTSVSPHLRVDLQNNQIPDVRVIVGNSNSYPDTLSLNGNPACPKSGIKFCQPPNQEINSSYSTSCACCENTNCPSRQKVNPGSCKCAYPYEGTLEFRAPRFADVTNATPFQALEQNLWTQLNPNPGSVVLQNPYFDGNDFMQVEMNLFPSQGKYFERSDISEISFQLTNHTFRQPKEFGPYAFRAREYPFPESNGRTISLGMMVGIAVGSAVLIVALVAVAIYAIQQKRRAEKAVNAQSQSYGSWGGGASGRDVIEPPKLKGSRYFSYEELRKCTGNFSASNEIGSGGYGKVYKGVLPSGQLVAIKRAQQQSMQGGTEFKTEIELLSRVHHKNLVALIGFCFDRDEQMLVYEFVPNGTLRDSLAGRSGIQLDWKRRLRIALGSARGLAYLHDLADPPIIHRDVKSTNILLDESLTAKVADFGLSKLVSDRAKGHISTQVKGTLGYLDPEYYMTQQLSERSDVYSFGVVMLELITGRTPIEKGRYVVREIRAAIDRSKERYGLTELLDPTIRNSTLAGFGRFVDLALSCVNESAPERPIMAEVVKEIETILQNEGLNTNPASESSSATDFGVKNNAPRHPYNEPISSKENSDAFSGNGGLTLSHKVDPK